MQKPEAVLTGMGKSSSTRRSQRRINKLLDKNISQYEIPNPYKNSKAHPYLPRNLSKQLSKMNCFSVRTLQSLQFNQPNMKQEVNELLLKMRIAVERQSEELTTYVAVMTKRMKKLSNVTADEEEDRKGEAEEVDQLNNSVFMPRSSQNSIELHCQNQGFQNLPLVSHQSEGVSMMSDNYEVDKLIFSTNPQLFRQMEEPLQLYQV